MQNATKTPQLTPAAAKAAMAAGVKPAALIHVVSTGEAERSGCGGREACGEDDAADRQSHGERLTKPAAKKIVHRRPKHRVASKKAASKAASPAKPVGSQAAAQMPKTSPVP